MYTVHSHSEGQSCNRACYDMPSLWDKAKKVWSSMFTSSLYPKGKAKVWNDGVDHE